MPNLKLADAYVDIHIDTSGFAAGLKLVIANLKALDSLGMVRMRLDRGAATSSLNLLQQQMNALKQSAVVNVKVNRPGGGMGGAGGGMGGPGFGTGLAQGLGVGMYGNPAMMGGQVLGAGIRESIGAAMEIQAIFVDLRRFTGESAANMERFKQTLFDISTTQAGVSFQDLAGMASAGAKAGISEKEGLPGLETFTRGMAKVKNAVTGIGTEKLTDNMIQMLNIFHKGTDYVESFGSVLAKMDQISTASADSILDMARGMSGTFASLNLGIKDVMSFSSVMADAALNPQKGAGAFEQILRKLASESEKMAGLIGVPIEKFQNLIRTDAMGALDLLLAKFNQINSVDPIKGQEFLVALGLRGIRTAGALQQVATIREKIGERTKIAEGEETNKTTLEASNVLNAEKSTGQVGLFKNAVTQFADAIGTQFLPAINKMAGMGTTALKSVSKAMSDKHYVRLDDGSIAERTQENAHTGFMGLTMRPEETPTDAELRQLAKVPRGTAVSPMIQGTKTAEEQAEIENAAAKKLGAEAAAKVAAEEVAAAERLKAAGQQQANVFARGIMGNLAFTKQQLQLKADEDKEKAEGLAAQKDKKPFQAKHFKDEADFARDSIQGFLSGDKGEKEERKEQVKELKANSKELNATALAITNLNKHLTKGKGKGGVFPNKK